MTPYPWENRTNRIHKSKLASSYLTGHIMNNTLADTPLTLLSPNEIWNRVDPLASDMGVEPSVANLADLPYAKLMGAGFERLCYELLVAEGHSPRFFGRSGQPDYGVDIVVETDGTRTVYQCKNLTAMPSWTDVRDAVTKFEIDWLDKAGLPHPDAFVYCCPHPLDDQKWGEKWTRFKDEFIQRTGVNVNYWDKHALDTRLQRLPDIVASLFSGSYAEHFCNRYDWLDTPWTRVSWGETRHAPIMRFFERHQNERINVMESDEELFQEILSTSSVLAIRGLPGSGKTFTGLELACRLRIPIRRIYYATFKDKPEFSQLWQSLKRRKSLPTLLLLDDCHLNLEQTGMLLQRLHPELSDSKGLVKLVLVLRDLPSSSSENLVDTPDWLLQLEQDGLVMDMKTDPARTYAVTVHLRPDFTGLSRQRRERLHHITGGDLLLLDEILQGIGSPQELDNISHERFYNSVRSQYFGGNVQLPTIQRLACLAQFELTPLASYLKDGWQPGEKNRAKPFMTELFSPHRYQFLHSSIAELIFRSLLALEIVPSRVADAVVTITARELINYLKHLARSITHDTPSNSLMIRTIELLLNIRLHLMSGMAEAQIKSLILDEEFIRNSIEKHLQDCSFSLLKDCLINLSSVSHPQIKQYTSFIESRIHMLFKDARNYTDSIAIIDIGTGLMTLARYDLTTLTTVQKKYGATGFLNLIVANGTLVELCHILQYTTPDFKEALLGQLDEAKTAALVDKTIAAGRFLGTLDHALRGLGNTDKDLLTRLEQIIGAERYLRLILATGTLFKMFHILQHITPDFREALLKQLDETKTAALVDKTIAAGCSIGTFNLTLRELGMANEALLESLEQIIGAERFLRLILANGTLVDLFRILQHTTLNFKGALLKQLDETKTDALVDKTIAAGCSIGTLNLTLRELGMANEALLESLEQIIGAERFLRLILANGTLVDLFRILQYTTLNFRKALLKQLDETKTAALVDRTIAAGRSIRTLDLTLRDLGNTDKDLLTRLEQIIGAERYLRLILANGTLVELFHILQHTTPDFKEALLGQLDETKTAALVDKTIAAGRSIGTLDLALRDLGNTDKDLLTRLEQIIGAERYLRLILANGTLFELFRVLQYTTRDFKKALLGQLDETKTAVLVDKTIAAGRSIGTLDLALRDLGNTDKDLLTRLEQIIGAERYLRLILANGTLVELFGIYRRSTPNFRDGLLGQLDEANTITLVDKAIAARRSIENFHHTLKQLSRWPNQLEKLERLLGVDKWWRLLIGIGTLYSLSQISRVMSPETKKMLVETPSGLSIDDWRGIITRGNFLDACTFSSEEIAAYPEPSRITFQEALRDTAAQLATNATWLVLNRSRPPTDPNSFEGQILRAAMQPRIEGIKPEDLQVLNFNEAISRLSFAWRERPDLQMALATRLWKVLPDPVDWPRDEGEVGSLRLVLVIARSELVCTEYVNRLLGEIKNILDLPVCAKIRTKPLFLLIWNICSLHYERCFEANHSFKGALSSSLIQIIIDVLRQRVNNKGPNEENRFQLALAGLISFLVPKLTKELQSILAPLSSITRRLYPNVETGFVTDFFSLKGIELLKPSEPVFTPFVSAELLDKSKKYNDIGPAIKFLQQQVNIWGER